MPEPAKIINGVNVNSPSAWVDISQHPDHRIRTAFWFLVAQLMSDISPLDKSMSGHGNPFLGSALLGSIKRKEPLRMGYFTEALVIDLEFIMSTEIADDILAGLMELAEIYEIPKAQMHFRALDLKGTISDPENHIGECKTYKHVRKFSDFGEKHRIPKPVEPKITNPAKYYANFGVSHLNRLQFRPVKRTSAYPLLPMVIIETQSKCWVESMGMKLDNKIVPGVSLFLHTLLRAVVEAKEVSLPDYREQKRTGRFAPEKAGVGEFFAHTRQATETASKKLDYFDTDHSCYTTPFAKLIDYDPSNTQARIKVINDPLLLAEMVRRLNLIYRYPFSTFDSPEPPAKPAKPPKAPKPAQTR